MTNTLQRVRQTTRELATETNNDDEMKTIENYFGETLPHSHGGNACKNRKHENLMTSDDDSIVKCETSSSSVEVVLKKGQ